jgi:thermostable 8-oxoguanine DNA glycosylase
MAPVAKARKTTATATKPSSRDNDSYDHANISLRNMQSLDSATTPPDLDPYVDESDRYSYTSLKRKRSLSSPCTPLLSAGKDSDCSSSCGILELSPRHKDPLPMALTIEVPPGHEGPLVVNIDINSLLAQAQSQIRPLPTCLSPGSQSCADSGYSSTSSVTSEISKPNTTSRRSFLDLPAEIRNQVYRLAFVSEEKLDFAYPNNFSRSSSLLQTCRQVHEEGRSILYSENTFYFQRRKKEQAVRWSTDVYEIGYKDIRFFLRSIGLANVSLLRRLIVMFEDAQPSMNTHLKDADERRFTNDDDLMDTLRVLGDHTMLKTLDLCFQGRRMFYNKDESRFIELLTRIKADQVKCINNPDTPFSNWKGLAKIASADAGRLVHEMTRRVTIFR